MAKRISLITVLVLLNMGIGRMFQESLGVACFSELSILAISSFFFWNVSAAQIKVWSGKWAVGSKGKNVLVQSGLGLSTSAVNILIGQALVIFLMTTVYHCTSPSFSVLNASLTNNIAVNLLCYFVLLSHFNTKGVVPRTVRKEKDVSKKHRISVSRNGCQFLLYPDQIRYVETSNNCIVIHTSKGRFVKYQSLKSFKETVCTKIFKRVHRSYLVNTEYIDRIQKNSNGDGILYLKCGDRIKFSRTYLHTLTDS